MTDSASTPGPWSIGESLRDYEGHKIGASDRTVAVTCTALPDEIDAEEGANARLIAAHVSMLTAACECALAAMETMGEECETEAAIIRAAIQGNG